MQSDSELTSRARSGDRGAFAQLVSRYERPVLATALHVLRCPEDARDVAQDVFLILWRKLGAHWGPRRVGPWTLRVARNAALRHRKRRARTRFGALPNTVVDQRPLVQ